MAPDHRIADHRTAVALKKKLEPVKTKELGTAAASQPHRSQNLRLAYPGEMPHNPGEIRISYPYFAELRWSAVKDPYWRRRTCVKVQSTLKIGMEK